MNIEEQLKLAAQIYALKVVLQPSWDLQKHARDSFSMATQFFLAVQAEQAGSSTDSHSSSQSGTVAPGTSSSPQPPPPGSTTDTPKQSATDSTAAAATGSETAPPAHTDLSQAPSQKQNQTTGRSIQEQPYAPLR